MNFNRNRAILTNGMSLMLTGLVCAGLASCSTTSGNKPVKKRSKEYFSEKEYGVKASPRVYTGRNVPKGGGRYQLGKPYQVKGKWYVPKEDFNYNKVGLASWYGSAFHGRLTANGEVYDQYHISAAHPTFPLPSYARVTNLDTGDSLIVRVNDRGPYHPGRIIDVSDKAAELLAMKQNGTAKVQVQYVGKARMDGHDMPYLMASYAKKGDRTPRFDPQIATGVMVASNETSIGLPDLSSKESASTALAETRTPASVQSFAVMGEFAALPEIGPIPQERPVMVFNVAGIGKSAVNGYVDERLQQSGTPFDIILVDSESAGRLNAEAIRNSWLRKNKGGR